MSSAQLAYRNLSTQVPGTLFCQPTWLDATLGADGWDAVVNYDAQGAPVAGLALPLLHKGPFRMVDLPVFTPHIGPLFAYPPDAKPVGRLLFAQAQLTDLVAQIPPVDYCYLQMPCGTDGLPFQAAGYELLMRYTHLLDLRPTESELWDGLKSSLRGQVRKAAQQLTIVPAADAEPLYALLQATYMRQELLLPLSKAQLLRTLAAVPHAHKIWHARDGAGNIHAALCLLHHQGEATVWISAQNPAHRDSAAASLLHWHAISSAKALGCHTLDFEGSQVPGIARFYRTFGSIPTPSFAARRVRHPLLRVWRFLRGH